MSRHVPKLTEDHIAWNSALADACERGECSPEDCASECYDEQEDAA